MITLEMATPADIQRAREICDIRSKWPNGVYKVEYRWLTLATEWLKQVRDGL